MAIPAVGPRPGKTPINVPASAPTRAANKLLNVNATLSPYRIPSSASMAMVTYYFF